METENFSTTFTYDNIGRLSTRTHPSGIVETNNYNTNGYLVSISAGGATRFTITTMNARQQITAATYGTSLLGVFGFDDYGYPTHAKAHVSGTYRQDYRYSFNTVTGNLNSRQNYLISKSESFTYDNLDRLLTGPEISMSYSANGNILAMDDLGDELHYNHPTKPYALTGFDTSSGLVPEALQTATYTSFEQPSVITESPYQATFTYNSEGQRAKMEVKQSGNTILTRWYAGSRYIKETAGAVTKEYWWLGGDAYSAPILALKQGSTTTYYYILRDHLGTITHLTNTSGTVQNRYSFDAWGRRRSPASWEYSLPAQTDLLPDRGFTGHEHLSWFNLVNMNGRLYDPLVGRFLSPDNYVQMPDFSQSYNRYSYCLNNPLKYTDPDGELFWIIPSIGWSKEGGLSIGISAVFGIPGSVLSVQAGANYSFGSNDFSIYRGVSALGNTAYWSLSTQSGLNVGFAFGATPYSGLPVSTNFLSAGVNYNITHNSWSGNVSAWQVGNGGWTFNPSVSAMVLPEQTTNLVRGQGFRNNEAVLSRFVEAGNHQGALDYFGFEGKYNPDIKSKRYQAEDYWGATDATTGEISYGNLAFENYATLYGTYIKESYHAQKIQSGLSIEKLPSDLRGLGMDTYLEEIHGYVHAYKRQGLFSGHNMPFNGIRFYQSQLSMFGVTYPTYPSRFSWIYKVPRRW
jgi:RHS repeat-associated protein